jgi:sRNA-binding carbon storage regulator CsrA
MLILSFSVGKKVVITVPPGYRGGEIVVMYLGHNQGHPRIGFEADREITIDREKVHLHKLVERGQNGNT